MRSATAALTMHWSWWMSVLCSYPKPGLWMFIWPLLPICKHFQHITSQQSSKMTIQPHKSPQSVPSDIVLTEKRVTYTSLWFCLHRTLWQHWMLLQHESISNVQMVHLLLNHKMTKNFRKFILYIYYPLAATYCKQVKIGIILQGVINLFSSLYF